jgi:hypothetical protein
MTQAFDAAGFGVAKGAGTTGVVEPYTNTQASMARVAQKVREARHDADLRGWAIDALAKAGFDGRVRTASTLETAQVLLSAVRAATTYVPDPAHTEWIQAPHVTLCLRDKCIRGGDCFPEGTLVLRKTEGKVHECVPIEDISPGETIWGLNEWTRVEATVARGILSVDRLRLSNGSWLELTEDHKVFDTFSTAIRVRNVKEGQGLLQPLRTPGGIEMIRSKPACVVSIDRKAFETPCYDIQTSDHYVYLPEFDVTVSNCDDLVTLVAALLLSVGIYSYLVRQEFGPGKQEHVLVGVYDERGTKLYIDPANTMTAVYEGSRASREFWVDPLDQVGETGSVGPDFVTLGALPGNVWTVPRPQLNEQLTPVGLGLTSVSDLDQLDAQVQAGVTGLQDAAKSCTGLSQSDQDSLAGFALAWSSLHNWWQSFRTANFGNWWNPTGPLTAAIALQFSTVAADMRGYLAKVGDWQTHLKAVCPSYTPPPGPVTPVPTPDVPSPAGELAAAIAAAAKAVGSLLLIGGISYGVFKVGEFVMPMIAQRRAKT